jgi:hypothetical protein
MTIPGFWYRGQATAKASWMVGGLHPVQAETKADPYGMTAKEQSNGKTKADPYGMTTKGQATARQKQIPTG